MDSNSNLSLEEVLTSFQNIINSPVFEGYCGTVSGVDESGKIKGNVNFRSDMDVYTSLRAISNVSPNIMAEFVKSLDSYTSCGLGSFEQVLAATQMVIRLGEDFIHEQVEVREGFENLSSSWPEVLQSRAESLLTSFNAKSVDYQRFIKVSKGFSNDYKKQSLIPQNAKELLAQNPDFTKFLDTIHVPGFKYPYMAAAAVHILSVDELHDKGANILDEYRIFHHTIVETKDGKKEPINTVEGDHVVGALLRHTWTQMLAKAKAMPELKIEKPAEINFPNSEIIYKLNAEENGSINATVLVPFETLADGVDINVLKSQFYNPLSEYLYSGKFIAPSRIRDVEIAKRLTLDLSDIADLEIRLRDMFTIRDSSSFTSHGMLMKYTIDTDFWMDDKLERESSLNEAMNNPFYVVFNSTTPGYHTVDYLSNPEKFGGKKYGFDGIFGIMARVNEKLAQRLEGQLQELYDAKIVALETAAKDNTAKSLFNLGALTLIKDKEKGLEYISQAIEKGFLFEEVSGGLLSLFSGPSLNRNPLQEIDINCRSYK